MKNYLKYSIVALALVLVTQFAHADTYTADLATGSTGAQVTSLQSLLEQKGFLVMPPGVAKGYFGAKTRIALIAFQKSLSLPATGYFGPLTRGRLNQNTQVSALTVTSPSGGESWMKGSYQTITWSAPQYFKATSVDIKLVPYYIQVPCPAGYACGSTPYIPQTYTIVSNISVDQHAYVWRVGDNSSYVAVPASCDPIPVDPITHQPMLNSNCGANSAKMTPMEGQYTIQICESGTTVCDSSDRPFSITKEQVTPPTVKVTSPNGGESWAINSVHQIMWANTDTASTSKVDIYLTNGPVCPQSTVVTEVVCPPTNQITLDKNIPTNSIYNWIAGTDVTNNPIMPGSYLVKICVAGTQNCDYSDSAFGLTYTSN